MKKMLCLLLVFGMLASLGLSALAEEPVTISFQTWNPGNDSQIFEIIEKFEAENPDIKINYIYMPYVDHVADMQIKMNNGEGPDIYGMQAGATYAEFRPFEEDLTAYAAAEWGDDWESNFVDFCMGLINVDDHYYGLPLGLTYAGLVWADKGALANLGLEIPTNYDELLAVSKALREAGELPLTIGAKDDWINIDTFLNIANDVNTEKIYSAIEGETSFEDPDLVEAFRIWQSLFTEGIVQDGAVGVSVYSDVSDLWRGGESFLHLNGSWEACSYLSVDPEWYDVFNREGADHEAFMMDWNNDGKPAGLQASIDVILCMNTNCKNKEAAWKFLSYMIYQGQDILINTGLQYMPARKDLELNVQGLNADGAETLAYIVDQANTNIAGYREMAYADLKQAIADALTALATGEITPEQAAANVEAASQAQAR